MWQEFSSFAHQIVRLYANNDHIETEYTIGPIPIQSVTMVTPNVECYCVIIGTRKVKRLLVAMTLLWQPTRCGTQTQMVVR